MHYLELKTIVDGGEGPPRKLIWPGVTKRTLGANMLNCLLMRLATPALKPLAQPSNHHPQLPSISSK